MQTPPASGPGNVDALKDRVRHDFTNHPPTTDDVGHALDTVTQLCINFATFIAEFVPAGREQSLALTQLEQCSMWCKAGIARNQ